MQERLTATEAAAELGVSVQTLMRWERQGKVHGRKLGRSWFFNRADIDALLSGEAGEAQ